MGIAFTSLLWRGRLLPVPDIEIDLFNTFHRWLKTFQLYVLSLSLWQPTELQLLEQQAMVAGVSRNGEMRNEKLETRKWLCSGWARDYPQRYDILPGKGVLNYHCDLSSEPTSGTL